VERVCRRDGASVEVWGSYRISPAIGINERVRREELERELSV
jgi:hypothetical protein